MLLCLLLAAPAVHAQSEGSLRNQIGASRARERSLAADIAQLGKLERQHAREVSILQGRLNDAQNQLNTAQSQLNATQTKLAAARQRANRLRKRLAQVRTRLSALLRARYMGDQPDFVTVVLHSDGFSQLLDTLNFVQRVERADANILDLVRSARADAAQEQIQLTALQTRQFKQAAAVKLRCDALAQITAGLQARQSTYATA